MRNGISCVIALSVTALLAACATTPERAASGCQDISGIIGREFRLGFNFKAQGSGGNIDSGANLGSTLPQISQDYRETLIMGDHLCRATETGLIAPEIYENFLSAQLSGIIQISRAIGGRSDQQVQSSISAALTDIAAVAPPRIARAIRAIDPVVVFQAPIVDSPFEGAKSIYEAVEDRLPPSVSAPYDSAYYIELSTKIDQLIARFDNMPPPEDVAIDTLGVVYFSINSSDLDAVARREVVAIVQAAGPEAKFRLEGFADPSGSFEHNLALSERRAEAVARYLAELGVSSVATRIGSGRTDQFGDASANRRVVIQRLP